MEVNKESLTEFVKQQIEFLNNTEYYNNGLVSKSELEPKFALLRQINFRFDLGIPREEIKDYWHRNPE